MSFESQIFQAFAYSKDGIEERAYIVMLSMLSELEGVEAANRIARLTHKVGDYYQLVPQE